MSCAGAHLLSGFRFSTAVWVWLVVRMETCSPSGPLVVEMTSYSEETGRRVTTNAASARLTLLVLS